MIVGILGAGGCGGTFLDWTVQYFGPDNKKLWLHTSQSQDEVVAQMEIDIVSTPLTTINAHQHQKTHPNDLGCESVIEVFKNNTQFGLHVFYCVGILKNEKKTWCSNLVKKHTDVKWITYRFDKRHIDTIFCLQQEKISQTRYQTQQFIMNNVCQALHTLPVWDQRELLSLYYPAEIADQTVNVLVEPAVNNFVLDFDIMTKSLDQHLFDLLDYLDIAPEHEKFVAWQAIYLQWKKLNSIEFFDNLDLIINNIVNGIEHDLKPYNITFAKEVVIASHLLYRHNLALKSYGKTHLASNTTQWTEILEPNVYHKFSII